MKTKQFYPLFALLLGLLLMLAFTGQAKAEDTAISCGDSIEETVTLTVTDDFEYGITRIESSSGHPDLAACGQEIEEHWSNSMCDNDPWRGYLRVPTACNTVTVSDSLVLTTTWVDMSEIWKVSGQELIRATVTETVPSPIYEVWDEDSGRDVHIWTDGVTTTVWLDSVGYNNWMCNEERQKCQLIISQKPFGASFNTGSYSVVWQDYSVFWEVSEENTVDRVLTSPTKVEIWVENNGRDLILVNLDGASLPVNIDGLEYNNWEDFGDGQRVILTLRGMPFSRQISLAYSVIWDNYASEYWSVDPFWNTLHRIQESPTKIQVFSENAGADIILVNLDGAGFDVNLDGTIYSRWTFDGVGAWLRMLGQNNAQMFNLGDVPVIWEDYSLDWDVDATSNNVVRVTPPVVTYTIFLPAVMR